MRSCRFLAEEDLTNGLGSGTREKPGRPQDSTLPSPNKKAIPHTEQRRVYKPFPIAVDMADGPRLTAIALGKGCAMGTMATCWSPRPCPAYRRQPGHG